MFFDLYGACFLSLFASIALTMPANPATATCPLGKTPTDPALFYTGATSASGCSRGGITINHSVRIEPWAVIYTAFNTPEVDFGPQPTCREEIVSVYRRINVIPKLYYRPAVFDKGADCSKVTIRKIMAWGPDRKEFTALLKRMEKRIKEIRITDCADDYFGVKKTWTRSELNGRIARERIATAALAIINGAAFNSYLCV